MIFYDTGLCSIGYVLVAKTNKGVCAIALDDDKDSLVAWCRAIYPDAQLAVNDELSVYLHKVLNYIEAAEGRLDIPLDIHGTAFQKRVWQALLNVPRGEQRSYTQLAEMVGKPSAVRAVANACATNLLAVVIPCHRIVKKDGSISGYRWGVQRKQWLLEKERAA